MVLTNSQHDAIMREYGTKQAISRHALEERTKEVYRKVPEYKNIIDEISSLSVKAATSAIKGNSKECEGLADSISSLSSRLTSVLTFAGFSPDYLEPEYECPICKDTGYVNNEKCRCFKQAAINLLYRQSNIKNILDTENFSNFSFDYYSSTQMDPVTGTTPLDNIRKVVTICKDFVKDFPNNDNLLFYGDTGVGKTFLTNCIAKDLLDHGNSVLYMSAVELFQYFSTYSDFVDNSGLDNPAPEMQIINCDLLIIDDLGTELINSFTNSKLFYCINNRLLEGKSTIISTNLTLEELMNAYSERIFSRISSSYKLLKLFGDDIRLLKKH